MRLPFTRPKPQRQFTVTVPPEMLEGMTYGGAIAPRISRAEALQVPAVLRARNLIAGTIATLPIHFYDRDREVARPTSLLEQVDPDVANVVTLSSTVEDLFFEGYSFWRVLGFNFAGYPSSATHVPVDHVHVAGTSGLPAMQRIAPDIPFPAGGQVFIDGYPVPSDEIILFTSPNPPFLTCAARAIRTCLRLDDTASKYARDPLPLGFFTPDEGVDPGTDEDIQDMLDRWQAQRQSRVWAYVGAGLKYNSVMYSAQDIQLSDQRQHAVIEIARAAGIDPEDLGVSTTTRTYQNAEQRRLDLLDFTLSHYVRAVEQRLSMNDVVPRGNVAKFNMDAFLRSDTKTRMDSYAVGKPLGAYTTEEIRELENRPSLTPAEQAAIEPQPEPVPAIGGLIAG